MEFLSEYISVIAFVAALCVGYVVKNIIPNKMVDNFIPAICAAVGVFILVWENGWVATPLLVVSGMLSGLAASGAYDQFKMVLAKWFGSATE